MSQALARQAIICMNEDRSSNGSGSKPGNDSGKRSWIDRITQAFASNPRNREDLINLIKVAHQQGVVDAEALAMVEGALEMGEMQARDVMIPRSQMVTLNKDCNVRDALRDIIESGHSRFPVVGEDKDEVIGVLLAKDLLNSFIGELTNDPGNDPGNDSTNDTSKDTNSKTLADYARPAAIIPESKRLNVLLRDFRVSRNHMAIVVDEYGGVSGLITIEDVLEEIVGDIDDETDNEEAVADIQKVSNDEYRVQALTAIEDFNEELKGKISHENYDTIGGIVVAEFGRVPEQGETIELHGFEFKITKADERRIHELMVLADNDSNE